MEKAEEQLSRVELINLSHKIHHRELLLVNDKEREPFLKYSPREEMPTGFWRSEVIKELPTNSYYRSKTCNKIVDGDHHKICQSKVFHYNHSNE